jgi:dephospho-CoA kinase
LIDTDVIARDVVMPGTVGLAAIEKRFGQEVLNQDGTLDRRALRRIVFADSSKRLDLESILHPLIRQETGRQMNTLGGAYQMVIVPLLVESPTRHAMDRVLVVDCDESVQLNRLLLRDTESEDQARKIIAAQASREERLSIGDDIIDNSVDLGSTRAQVDQLHQMYLSLAAKNNE